MHKSLSGINIIIFFVTCRSSSLADEVSRLEKELEREKKEKELVTERYVEGESHAHTYKYFIHLMLLCIQTKYYHIWYIFMNYSYLQT